MLIDVKASNRLAGKTPVDIAPLLAALAHAAPQSSLDLSRLRVVLDWVQYRQSFRSMIDVRKILPSALQAGNGDGDRPRIGAGGGPVSTRGEGR